MKTAGKVALVGLGIGAIFFVAKGGPMALMMFDRPQKKLSPEEEQRWQEGLARRGPLPKIMRAPDGSMVPVVGSVGNSRGQYD
jgi:hypothetical protein